MGEGNMFVRSTGITAPVFAADIAAHSEGVSNPAWTKALSKAASPLEIGRAHV